MIVLPLMALAPRCDGGHACDFVPEILFGFLYQATPASGNACIRLRLAVRHAVAPENYHLAVPRSNAAVGGGAKETCAAGWTLNIGCLI
jgi:hypothetical protein